VKNSLSCYAVNDPTMSLDEATKLANVVRCKQCFWCSAVLHDVI